MEKGYHNSAFGPDDSVGVQTTSMELERVIITGKTTAKCCGSSNVQNHYTSNNNPSNTSGHNVTSDACLPKCPAVRPSPWDPIKTRFAAVLTIGIIIWFLLGIFVTKF